MAVEHLDVLIVGAGISGIGAGRYLKTELPAKTFAILEARGASGGTWDLFRYPGHPVGLRPAHLRLRVQAVARRGSPSPSAPRILAYLRETATENGLDAAHPLPPQGASARPGRPRDGAWTVEVERTDTGERLRLTASWMFCAGGYYRYDEGFTPSFAGRDRFRGTIVHPQHWPEDLDYTGKRVVVIGSGATAVTLVPAMAGTAAHVTMLQRTPTLRPAGADRGRDRATRCKKCLGAERGHALDPAEEHRAAARRSGGSASATRSAARRLIRWVNARQLPEGYPVDEHFNPPYDPWDQRLCAGAGRRPVQGDPRRHGLGGHRPDRDLHRDRHPAGLGPRARRPTSSSPPPG